MSWLNLDQEQRVIDALVPLQPTETIDSLKAASVRTIEGVLDCSRDRAQEILNELRSRNLIEATVTPRGGALDVRERMPVGRFRWVLPYPEV